jgi:hypothetical protein
MKSCVACQASSNENSIPPGSYLTLFDSNPYRFTHPALEPVPVHCFPDPPSYNETESAVPQTIGQYGEHQQRMNPGLSLTAKALKVNIRTKTMLLVHDITGL